MDDSDIFLSALQEKPNDTTTRLVYADWLEEQGGAGTDQAAFLRLEAEWTALPDEDARRRDIETRLRELAQAIDADWLAVVSARNIENCRARFAYRCPKRWDNLTPTSEDGVRFCEGCSQNVYYCDTLEEAWEHADDGHCVAVSAAAPRQVGDLPRPREMHVTMGIMHLPDDFHLPQHNPGPPTSAVPVPPPQRSWWARLFGRRAGN